MKTANVYVSTSCSSSRKAVAYFKENNIPFREIKLTKETIMEKDLDLLMQVSTGFEDIIKSKRLGEVLDLSTKECKKYIMENPSILRTPIVIQGFKTNIGFNEDGMGMFLNREQKLRGYKKLVSAIAI